MLTLNASLKRSVTERWARARKEWSQYDGLVRVTDATRPFLQKQRLNARPYSVSALQQFAACPYRFFLSAAYRLSPLEEPEPLQRMDPLTKGSLFHQVQAEFFRALQKAKLSIATGKRDRVLKTLDDTLTRIAAEYYERLAPAIDRVWQDEIASMRTDLRVWVDQLATNAEWEPWLFEFAFGLPGQPGHDPASLEGSGDGQRQIHPSRVGRSRRAQARHEDSARDRSQDRKESFLQGRLHRWGSAAAADHLQPRC